MIKIFKGKAELAYKFFLFPAGECGVKLDVDNDMFRTSSGYVTLVARIQNSNDFMQLAMIVDAVKEFIGDPNLLINLHLYYVPYARQDRMCVKGESFSLKVFSQLINSLNFRSVTIADPHSDVCPALINNVKIIKQSDILTRFSIFAKFLSEEANDPLFVAPDAGSNKKTSEIAKIFGHKEFIRADKLRNLATGEIIETVIYTDDLKGRDIIIADDLADAGGTFIGLAKVLKAKNAGKIALYVTHGLFTKGTKNLFSGGIDKIFSTNSYYDVWPSGVDDIVTFKLEDYFLN